ncbi:syntaxin [Mycena sp. CBHHK59/15]|nr:syntaxin [Mycena sp. CBHHK59/15]
MAQSVFIPKYEERSTPSPHTVYEVKVKANVRNWSMWRRYSEFDDLHTELFKAAGEAPPHPCHPNTRSPSSVGETYAFRQFLGIPIGKQGEFLGQFTLSSWLDEHLDLQTRIRDIRADINKRDALADRGDPNGSHNSNVSAKKTLAGVISRLGKLATGLQELAMGGMSEGELQRRTEMVARMRDDCEKLGKMVTVADRRPARSGAWAALMGGGASKPFGRVFGAAAKAKETEETRPLDDRGLLMLQEAKMQQQDVEVSQLTTVLQRHRHLGEAISNELAIQIEMLDDLANRVDETSGKIASTNREMNRLR